MSRLNMNYILAFQTGKNSIRTWPLPISACEIDDIVNASVVEFLLLLGKTWDHWTHSVILENWVLLKPVLVDICSSANYIAVIWKVSIQQGPVVQS